MADQDGHRVTSSTHFADVKEGSFVILFAHEASLSQF